MARGYTTVAFTSILLILSFSCFMNISCTSVIIPVTSNTFSTFVTSSNVRLVHVSYAASTKNIESFLTHYKKAAEQLEPYGILSGQVICDEFSNFEYCKRERTERFLFGFRGTKERLVLPIITLADENAIVASALHLALIHSVPIIQTSSELNNLEKKCYGKCNIVLAYHNTLGTLEHKLFLQLAWANQQENVFALTTSLHASPGDGSTSSLLSPPVRVSQVPHKQLVGLWLLQCKHFTPSLPHHEPCPVSLFRNNFSSHHINMFTKALQLPIWLDIEGRFPTTFSQFGLHQIILVYDETSKSRVIALAEPLGLSFRGSAGILTCPYNSLDVTPLSHFKQDIFPPALVFVPAKSDTDSDNKPNILNQLEGAYGFILEQLRYEELYEISKENDLENNPHYFLKTPLIGFQEDNELSKQISFKIDSAFGWDYLGSMREEKNYDPKTHHRLIIYYLDWDVVSQVTLKLLSSKDLSHLGVGKPKAISCFVNADKCNTVDTFPTLEVIGLHQSKRFGALSQDSMLHEIYLFLSPQVSIFWNRKSIIDELNSDKFNYISEVAIMAARNLNETNPVAQIIAQLSKKILFLVAIHDAAAYICQEFKCTLPCLAVKNMQDLKTPVAVYQDNINNLNRVKQFVNNTILPVFPQLTPELLPFIRNKILVASIGDSPSQDFNKVAHLMDNSLLYFTWIPRHSFWFKEIQSAHAPGKDNALIALHLVDSRSYLYPNVLQEEEEIKMWLQRVLSNIISPTTYLVERKWKPLQPAVDYLKLLEDERNKQDESIMLDSEDPFVSTEALTFTERESSLDYIGYLPTLARDGGQLVDVLLDVEHAMTLTWRQIKYHVTNPAVMMQF